MLGQPMRPAAPQRGQTPQAPSARQRPAWGARMGARPQAPMGPPGQMKTAGPPMGSFNNLQIPGRPPVGGAPVGGAAMPQRPQMPMMPPSRGIPGGEMGGGDMSMGGPEDFRRRLQVQQAAGVFDKPQPQGPDPRAEMMANQQAIQSRMQQFQRPGPPQEMNSIQPPQMRPDAAAMQQKMLQANQMRDQFRMNNPDAMQGAPPEMGGRQMPDMAAMRERMLQMRGGGGGPVY